MYDIVYIYNYILDSFSQLKVASQRSYTVNSSMAHTLSQREHGIVIHVHVPKDAISSSIPTFVPGQIPVSARQDIENRMTSTQLLLVLLCIVL